MWGTVQSPPKFSMALPRKLLVDFKLKGTQWRIFPNVKQTFTNLIFKKLVQSTFSMLFLICLCPRKNKTILECNLCCSELT
jgi:hypothetical protein